MLATGLVVGLLVASGEAGPGSRRQGAPTSTATSTTVAARSAFLPTLTLDNYGAGGRTWTGIEPSFMGFSGDAGDVVSGIAWTQWTTSEAAGKGTWGYDDCVPDCAEGTVTDYPALIRLSGVVHGHFTKVVERTEGPHGFDLSFADPSPTGWRPWMTTPASASTCERLSLTLGRRIGGAMDESAVLLVLTNRGGRPCTLDGYPDVSLFGSKQHLLAFSYTDEQSQYLASLPPLDVRLVPGGHAFVLLAKQDCAVRDEANAVSLRLVPPGSSSSLELRFRSGGLPDCAGGSSDPENQLAISPVAATVSRLLPS